MQRGIARLRRRRDEVEAFDPKALTQEGPDLGTESLSKSIESSLAQTFGEGSAESERYRGASFFERSFNLYSGTPLHEIQSEYARCRQRSLEVLDAAIKDLEERREEANAGGETLAGVKVVAAAIDRSSLRKVFIVHGREEGPREAVARFIEKIGFVAVILHEQANKGRTIITKFEEEAAGAGFAVVLLTPDDFGGIAGWQPKPRARQNVVFELGFFIGRLGPDRVAPIVVGEIELPSDYDGVGYIKYEDDWRAKLAAELKEAGFEIDWNKVMAR